MMDSEGATVKATIFHQSSERICQAIALCSVNLVSFVRLNDTVDPNSEVITHSLRYKNAAT